jgi:hypothetical protein
LATWGSARSFSATRLAISRSMIVCSLAISDVFCLGV